jgi:hypothetical protein
MDRKKTEYLENSVFQSYTGSLRTDTREQVGGHLVCPHFLRSLVLEFQHMDFGGCNSSHNTDSSMAQQ